MDEEVVAFDVKEPQVLEKTKMIVRNRLLQAPTERLQIRRMEQCGGRLDAVARQGRDPAVGGP